MRFTDFIKRQLDRQRGLQSRLAKRLEVSRSTITAWRQGAKPTFEICIVLAHHFRMDPIEIFEMIGDDTYKAIYERLRAIVLARTPPSAVGDRSVLGGPVSEPNGPRYRDPAHDRLHEELQRVLESGSDEAQALATMIEMAAQQVDKKTPLSRLTPGHGKAKAKKTRLLRERRGSAKPQMASEKRLRPQEG